ncbi:hypothetical protein C9J12_24055 [Photobacterium frigidiphilum]|uniref:Uncharacterized protein n=1 Tax=Photobacterium frigidiphilum TaxID=264736 RepID=A0A2T3J8S0_9GAMM|nr:hypothetical protein [Photobacterium frigidiphilum]PSU45161.1 hypothetical protein C9J12_24055 [Photobacterium frigidiphilum]
MKKTIVLTLLSTFAMFGCEAINMTRAAGLMLDYNLLASGASVFNSQDGSQYLIPPAHDSNKDLMLVCYTNSGLFSDTEEQPLRDAANEWLSQNKDGMVATASKNRSGVWESRTCYEFQYENKELMAQISRASGAYIHDYETKTEKEQPIGAYLDEETGDVVIVGETNSN